MKAIEEYVRSIPDFPEPGIIFRDVTSILQDFQLHPLLLLFLSHYNSIPDPYCRS